MKHKRSLLSIAMAALMLVSLCAVCASTTSVNAAPGSANLQSALVSAPASIVGAPGACVLKGTDTAYVFVRGLDGGCWYKIWDITTSSWVMGSTWTSLGGILGSSPSAVSREAGIISVYVAGVNGAVYRNGFYNGAWHGWEPFGGQVAPGTGPGASGWPGREDVFVEGTNGALYHKWTGNPNWENLGGQLTWSPSAVSREAGKIDVVVRGTYGAIHEKSYSNTWSTWINLGGQVAPGTGPAICSYGTIREDLFWKNNADGFLWQKTWIGGLWSANRQVVSGKHSVSLSSSPSAVTGTYRGMIDIDVFYRGDSGDLCYVEYFNGLWWNWMIL